MIQQWLPLMRLIVFINHSFMLLDRPVSGDGNLEGVLNRKHEWESTTKKASNRSVHQTL